jgi:hypothetical protein
MLGHGDLRLRTLDATDATDAALLVAATVAVARSERREGRRGTPPFTVEVEGSETVPLAPLPINVINKGNALFRAKSGMPMIKLVGPVGFEPTLSRT